MQNSLQLFLLLIMVPAFTGNGQAKDKNNLKSESVSTIPLDTKLKKAVLYKADSINNMVKELVKELKNSGKITHTSKVQIRYVIRKSKPVKPDTVYLKISLDGMDSLIADIKSKIKKDTVTIYIDRPVLVEKKKNLTAVDWLRRHF